MWAALLTVYVVWGSTYLAIRVAVRPDTGEGLPPLLMAGVRFALAGALMLAVTVRRPAADGRPDPLGPQQWVATAVVGTALCAGGNGLVSLAEQHIASGLTAVIIATVPMWVALFAGVRGGDRTPPSTLAGLALGFAGVVLLVGGGSAHADLRGVTLVLVAALSWASGSFYSSRAALPRRPLVGTGMEMLCGGVVLLAGGLLTGEAGRLHLGAVAPASWWALLYLGVFGSVVAYTAYVWLLRTARLSLVTTYAYVNPVVAVLLGTAFAGERLTARTLLAAAVILVGVVLIVSGPRPGVRP